MDYFNYQDDGQLWAENVPLSDVAEQFGTPLYVYSRATLERHWNAFDKSVGEHPHLVCYAVKANSNLGVLNTLARLGSGFDIVSGGELERVIAAGGDPSKVVFSGVGKTAQEMKRALELGIKCFNVESEPELERLNQVAAEMGVKAPISLRINPDVDANTHPYISTGLRDNKFGIAFERAPDVYKFAQSLSNLEIKGIDCHIGSQLTETKPFVDALERVMLMIEQLNGLGIQLKHIDIGGGLGVTYKDEVPPTVQEYANALKPALQKLGLKVYMEPGRSISANAGILLTRVDLLKPTNYRNFAIIDAAMNDLIRPALYEAWMDIQPVEPHQDIQEKEWDIVGAICETGDFLGKERKLALAENDLLAVLGAGAYGFVMSSNYNTRARAAEVMVNNHQAYLVRERETIESLWEREHLLPEV